VRTSRVVVAFAVSAIVLAASGCSSSEPDPKPSATASATAKAFEPPAGVTLTPGGTTLHLGESATVVYQAGDDATSAMALTVLKIKTGSMDDFRDFSLDEATKKSSPFYVRVSVKNEGPAGLGGAALPVFALDSSATSVPANQIVGTFKPCQNPTLPDSFLPGATADVCLVYLLPEGRTLTSVNLQTGAAEDAISWKP
jgi:hypothetical protein